MSSPSFRTVRRIRTLNLVLQAVLFLTFFAGLNYVAENHSWRFDLTQQRKFSLSPETLSYVKNLQRPVRIVLTVAPDDEDNPEVKGLIDEYVYATKGRPNGRITGEVLDVYQNRKGSEALGIETAGLVVLISGDKRRAVTLDELYTMKDKVRSAFRGEQVLTAAILDVASPGRERVYFLAGHSELRPSDTDATRGLSATRDQLKVRNFDVDELDLTVTRKIPADASLLVGVWPRSAFSRAEQELLRQYLSNNAGRLLLFLAPGMSAASLGLEDLLFDWGVLVHNDIVWDTGQENIAENHDLLIRAYAPHPITQTLIDYGKHLRLGAARTVMPDPGRSTATGLTVLTLAATSPSAWGERDFRAPPRFDPTIDTRPLPGMEPADRLGVAVASERVAVRDNLPFSVRGGKLVVFGTGDLIANNRIYDGNLAVFLNAVNWAVDRDRQLSIPPRTIERFQVSLSGAEFTKLRYALLLVLPGAALALGLVVYWTRRA